MDANVERQIDEVIRRVAEERSVKLPTFGADTEIVDELGFTSLMVATLIANLEDEFGVDPFQDEDVMITDIRTVGDLCRVYAACLEKSR